MINLLAAVIWDMDGVLADTGPLHFAAWQRTLAEEGIPFGEAEFRQTFGMNNESLLHRLLGERYSRPLYDEITRRKESRFRAALAGRVSLFAGALPLLRELHAGGIPQAIGSSAPQPNIDAIVGELEIGGYLDAIVSAAEMPGKPDPAVFLTAAARLGVPPARCVVVEDAPVGIAAARSAGMSCVAVATTNPAAALQAADRVVASLEELDLDDLLNLASEKGR